MQAWLLRGPTRRCTLAVFSLSTQFQSRQRPRATAELVDFNAEALEHADEEIAERRRILGIEGKVLAVLKATAGQEHREILGGMAAAVAEVAAEEDGGEVEQG